MASAAVLFLSQVVPMIVDKIREDSQRNKDSKLSPRMIRIIMQMQSEAKAAGLENYLPKIITDPDYFTSPEDRQAYEEQVADTLDSLKSSVQYADAGTLGKAQYLKQLGFDVDVNTGAMASSSATAYGTKIEDMWQRAMNTQGRQVTADQAANLANTRYALPEGYTFKTAQDYQKWQSDVAAQGSQVYAAPDGTTFYRNSAASK